MVRPPEACEVDVLGILIPKSLNMDCVNPEQSAPLFRLVPPQTYGSLPTYFLAVDTMDAPIEEELDPVLPEEAVPELLPEELLPEEEPEEPEEEPVFTAVAVFMDTQKLI